MPKYVDSAGLSRFWDNIADRPVYTFDTIAEMQAATYLEDGMTCHTNGFHASGDGGAAYYTIGASGTANGMDVLALQNGLFATIVVTEPYVTPEMFGAYGDGTHDDTAAFGRMFSVAKNCMLSSTYVVENCNLSTSGIRIVGTDGASIDYGTSAGIIVSATSHDIEISGITFNGDFNIGSSETSNSAIVVYESSKTSKYDAYNIVIRSCTFSGGSVFGIAATNVAGLTIDNCFFGGFVYKPADSAGGYAILTQSCRNVSISNCKFVAGDYHRHDIYISVDQEKTENKSSENVSIANCSFDHSDMHILSGNTAYYSPNTVCVNVRACEGLEMTNCRAEGATGLITCEDGDGFIRTSLSNCTSVNPKYFSSSAAPSETKAGFNFLLSSNASIVNGDSCNEVEAQLSGHLDVSVTGGTLYWSNAKMNYRYILNCDYITMHDIQIKASGNMQRTASSVLLGKIYAIYGGSYYIFDRNYTKNIHPSVFSSDLMGTYTIDAAGVYLAPMHPYVYITHELVNGIHTITMPNISQRPSNVQCEQYGTINNFIFVKVYGSDVDVNQFTLSKYNTSAQLVNGSSGNGIKFTVVG